MAAFMTQQCLHHLLLLLHTLDKHSDIFLQVRLGFRQRTTLEASERLPQTPAGSTASKHNKTASHNRIAQETNSKHFQLSQIELKKEKKIKAPKRKTKGRMRVSFIQH